MVYEAYIRYLKEDVLDKEGEDIKLIVRDTDAYLQKAVVAKIWKERKPGTDELWILEPLGRPYTEKPFGLQIIKEEDEDMLLDKEFHKACIKV